MPPVCYFYFGKKEIIITFIRVRNDFFQMKENFDMK